MKTCKICTSLFEGVRCKECKKAYDQKRRRGTTYGSFRCAQRRCKDRKHSMYYLYGERGIEFKIPSVEELERAIGPRPFNKTLDRINPEGHYEIGNVRWADPKEQYHNKRINA